MTLRNLIASHRTPGTAPAVRGPAGALLDHATLSGRIRDWAQALNEKGIGRNDRLALVLPDGPGTAVLSLAVSSVATAAPLNPELSRSEFEAHLDGIRPCAVLLPEAGHAAAGGAAQRLGIPVWTLGDAAGSVGVRGEPLRREIRAGWAGPDDVALLLPTSGTSARPKRVPLTHRNLCRAASCIREVLELSSEDCCLNIMPLFHIHGLSLLYASLAAGGSVACVRRFDPGRFAEWLQEFRPTWFSAAPAMHRMLLDALRGGPGVPAEGRLRFIRSASAPMPAAWIREMEACFGVPFIEAYGMTETGPQIASNRLPPHPRKLGSVGRAAGPEVAVADPVGRHLGPGQPGEVVVRGPNVVCGYDQDPVADAHAFQDGWLRTGDLGYLDADGDLFITGRVSDVINRGGEKVSPHHVESVLREHPDVAQAVVFATDHPVLGQLPAALVVPRHRDRDGAGNPLGETLPSWLASRLAPFEMPQPIRIVDEIPVGPGGKIRRRELAALLAQDAPKSDPEPAPSTGNDATPVHRRLAGLWEEVLGVRPDGPEANFFSLGGHSLAATRLAARVREVFGLDLSEAVVFQKPTIAALVGEIGQQLACRLVEGGWHLVRGETGTAVGGRDRAVLRRRPRAAPLPLSYAQQRLWFLDRVDSGPAYHMAIALRLTGLLDRAVLAAALGRIRDRHEVLRTTFPVVGGEPVQNVGAPGLVPVPLRELNVPQPAEPAAVEQALLEEFERPFDLAAGPLLRAAVVSTAPRDHRLLVTVHHIVFDGWSTAIFLQELSRTCRVLASGWTALQDLFPLPLQYADYSAWQREWCCGPEFEAQLDYWRRQLREAPVLCTFPPDRPRPAVQTHRGACLYRRIPPAQVAALRALGHRHQATLYMTLLATFQALLSRYSGQRDCVVGTAVANRTHPELENLIGFFANTLVLRTDLSGDPDFPELLGRVRSLFLEALAHQDVPFERLVNALHVDRDLSRMPFFQVMLVFQNLPGTGGEQAIELGPDLLAQPTTLERHGAKFDLTLYLQEDVSGLDANWLYNADLYDPETVGRIAAHFEAMLERLAQGTVTSVSHWTRIPESEARRLDLLGRGPKQAEGSLVCHHHQFEALARATPDAEAVDDGVLRLTYGGLNARANRLARRLREEGVGIGVRVGVLMARSTDTIVSLLAISKAGGVFVGLDASHPGERIRWILEDSGVSVVVTASPGPLPEDGRPGVRTIAAAEDDGASGSDPGDLGPIASPEDLAYIIYTSGTMGRPRGVTLSHGNLAHYVGALGGVLGVGPGDRYLHTASFGFSSSVRQFALPLCLGATVVVASPAAQKDPSALWETVGRERITVLDLVPSHWRLLLEGPEAPSGGGGSLRLVVSASEPLPMDIPRRWRRHWPCGVRFFNLYGQSETTGIVLAHRLDDGAGDRGPVTPLGRPIPGIRIRVVDCDGEPAPAGVEGEIQVAGGGVGPGYLNDPPLTASRFIVDPKDPEGTRWYRTGDLGRLRADGCLEFLGRRDLQVKVRGVRVEPGEIEGVLMEHPDVRRCAVVAETPAPAGASRLVAFVERTDPAPADDAWCLALRGWLRSRLPPALVPSVVRVLERLPMNPNGKLDRPALVKAAAAADGESRVLSREFLPPRTPVEQCLADIWRNVLRVDRVSREDNFFDLGGDSLLSVQVVLQARQAGLDHDLRLHFRHQTIASLGDAGLGFCERAGRGGVVEAPAPDAERGPGAGGVRIGPPPVAGSAASPGIRIPVERLRAFGREALERAGLAAEGARVVTEVQLEATLRGQPTHHMDSIPRYARRLSGGRLNGQPTFRVEREDAVSAVLDADNAPGQWAASVAMDLAIRKAKAGGLGMVTVRRSNHLGAAGHYAWEAAREGLIGFCSTNGPTILAPTGGVTPTFGNNPLGVGIPAGRHRPILLDIAMSVAPRGRIARQVAQGLPLPAGWILDRLGRPSTELADLAAGLGVPIGGHKGYGLALVLEVMSGVLSGAGFTLDHDRERLRADPAPADIGHWFLVVDPGRFLPRQEFAARVDRLIAQTKSGACAEGTDEILVPGERELRTREISLREGAFLDLATHRTLIEYGKVAGLQTRLDPIEG
ncbi:MAG: amino acid adenylation domain-containing protein [Verrucomicrobiae bacterium]|nr:amino acid adenylation domain-containing protein [Verrucomicrobiae bacterium]